MFAIVTTSPLLPSLSMSSVQILLDPSLLQSRKKTAKLSEKVQAAMKADKDKSREMVCFLVGLF